MLQISNDFSSYNLPSHDYMQLPRVGSRRYHVIKYQIDLVLSDPFFCQIFYFYHVFFYFLTHPKHIHANFCLTNFPISYKGVLVARHRRAVISTYGPHA